MITLSRVSFPVHQINKLISHDIPSLLTLEPEDGCQDVTKTSIWLEIKEAFHLQKNAEGYSTVNKAKPIVL